MTTIFEHGYALIVGVDANQIPRLALPAVAKDVQAIYDVLVHPERCAYDPKNVKLLQGEESTRENILDALYWLQEKVKGDDQATAVIYYSGHGMVDKATDQYYLIPYNITELSRIRVFSIRAEDFSAEISALPARRMLAILDCCHAGGMDVKDVDLEALEQSANAEAAAFPLDIPLVKNIPVFDAEPGAKAVSDLLEGEGRAVLNSSTGAQSSYIRTDGKMSLFTYHLIESLTGHASQPDDSVVYVTDVMSWVTRRVKESARAQNRNQTPVMKTSGVFPIAQVIGGMGVAKGIGAGQPPPDPLQPLPVSTGGMQAEGGIVTGTVQADGDFAGRDMSKKEGGIHFGDGGTATFQGPVAGGDQSIHHGDTVHGEKVGGDKVGGAKISVGDISGSQGVKFAGGDINSQEGGVQFTGTMSGGTIVGRDQHTVHQGSSDQQQLAALFTPLIQEVRQQNEAAAAQVRELQAEIARGEQADDEKVSDLIMDITEAAPAVVETLVGLFTNSIVAKAAGAGAKATLRLIQRRR